MPDLISKTGYSVPFEKLDVESIQELPRELKNVASLIVDWQAGKAFFELHTSGSTGTPKTIQLSRDKIEFSARLTASTFGLNPGDTLFLCLETNYVAGF